MKNIIKENSIIKDVKNIFKLKKIDDNTVKSIRNLFRLKLKTKNENETIKDRIITDIVDLFNQEREDY